MSRGIHWLRSCADKHLRSRDRHTLRPERRNSAPVGISPLWRDKVGYRGKRVEKAYCRMRSKIGGKKPKMKIRATTHCADQRLVEGGFVGTTPIHTMMQQRGRRMQLGQNPLIFAAANRVSRFCCNLQIGRRICVFVEERVLKIIAHDMAIFDRELVLGAIDMWFQTLPESGFYFLKGDREGTSPGPLRGVSLLRRH